MEKKKNRDGEIEENKYRKRADPGDGKEIGKNRYGEIEENEISKGEERTPAVERREKKRN